MRGVRMHAGGIAPMSEPPAGGRRPRALPGRRRGCLVHTLETTKVTEKIAKKIDGVPSLCYNVVTITNIIKD